MICTLRAIRRENSSPFADGFVKRRIFIGVDAADHAGEGLGAVPQHVDIGIDDGFGKLRRAAVYEGRAVRFIGAEGFHDVRPYFSGGAQFRDFHEEVRALVELEGQCLRHLVDRQAAFLHLAQIFHGDGIRIGHFLHAFRATKGEDVAADQDSAQARRVFAGPADGGSHFVIQRIQRLGQAAFAEQFAQGIGSDDATQGLDFTSSRLQGRHGHGEKPCAGFPRIEHIRDFLQLQAGQQGVHIFHRCQADARIPRFRGRRHVDSVQGRAVYTDMIDGAAAVDFEFQQIVVFPRLTQVAGLGDTPRLMDVAVYRTAAQIVAHAGIIVGRQNRVRILSRVHRIERDAFVVLGVHDLVERLSFQQRLASLDPSFVRRRGKFVELDFGIFSLFL